MGIISGFALAAKVLRAFGEVSIEEKARDQAAQYLIEKYSLSPVEHVTYGIVSQYANWEIAEICDNTWETALTRLLQTVLAAGTASTEVMIVCGDIGFFFIVLAGKDRFRMPDTYSPGGFFSYAKGRAYWPVESFRDGETLRSLLEMGRGRGSDLALRLIQGELQEWLQAPNVEPIRKAVAALS